MVRRRITTLLAGGMLALALFGSAGAGQFEDGQAASKRGDYSEAVRLWRPLAEQGDARAQFWLGLMYFNGQGLPQDFDQGATWFRKAADQGYAAAQTALIGCKPPKVVLTLN
jgi:TPR repeat protein